MKTADARKRYITDIEAKLNPKPQAKVRGKRGLRAIVNTG